MPQIDDIRRLWSEGRDVTEIARMTGHDRKTVRKYLQLSDIHPEASLVKVEGGRPTRHERKRLVEYPAKHTGQHAIAREELVPQAGSHVAGEDHTVTPPLVAAVVTGTVAQ